MISNHSNFKILFHNVYHIRSTKILLRIDMDLMKAKISYLLNFLYKNTNDIGTYFPLHTRILSRKGEFFSTLKPEEKRLKGRILDNTYPTSWK